MVKHKNKILAGSIIAAVLVLVFLWGGNSPANHGSDTTANQTITDNTEVFDTAGENMTEEDKPQEVSKPESPPASDEKAPKQEDIIYTVKNETAIPEEAGTGEYKAEPVRAESQETVASGKALTCTLSVRCDTILDNLEWLDEEKKPFVPTDGVIFKEESVIFYEGESVFELLMREMKKNGIHLEFVNTPMYNSAYIEGIGNLYEFDCGELSGWMYRVNGWFPNYGCSRYQLRDGDKVEWVYTCDLGKDVGGDYSAKNGN